MEWAIAMEWRTDNPCDRLLHLLDPQHDVVRHHQALPHGEVAAAIERVRAADPGKVDTLAFEFLVLTAARGGEVRGAVWSEVDRGQAVWTVPGSRMKAGRQHRVPLCDRALEIIDDARKLAPRRGSEAVAPGFGGVSGNLRAAGSPESDDRRSPRGTGRAESGRRGRAPPTPRSDGSACSPSPSVRLATERSRSLPATARPPPSRAARGDGFAGGRGAGLSHC